MLRKCELLWREKTQAPRERASERERESATSGDDAARGDATRGHGKAEWIKMTIFTFGSRLDLCIGRRPHGSYQGGKAVESTVKTSTN